MRASLYLRVSTEKQSAENQERDLRPWAAAQGHEIVATYTDTESGVSANRAGLRAALEGARLRRFDLLLVWALDRLSREGIIHLLGLLEELNRSGVQVRSFREGWMDTGSPMWSLLAAVFAWVAEQERLQHVARVKAGVERARARGRPLGRPARLFDVDEVRRRRQRGQGWSSIARAMKIPATTLRRRVSLPLRGGRGG